MRTTDDDQGPIGPGAQVVIARRLKEIWYENKPIDSILSGIGSCGMRHATTEACRAFADNANFPGGKEPGSQQSKPLLATNTVAPADDVWLTLENTEGAPFRFKGDVWLEGPPKTIAYPSDMPDGMGIFIRAKDGLHRYSLTPDRVLVKRRHHEGILERTIAQVAAFQPPPRHQWIPFVVDATASRIEFTVQGQTATIKGPIDMDGANQIALAKGSKLRNLSITITPTTERK
jgi:hypothetical protein